MNAYYRARFIEASRRLRTFRTDLTLRLEVDNRVITVNAHQLAPTPGPTATYAWRDIFIRTQVNVAVLSIEQLTKLARDMLAYTPDDDMHRLVYMLENDELAVCQPRLLRQYNDTTVVIDALRRDNKALAAMLKSAQRQTAELQQIVDQLTTAK